MLLSFFLSLYLSGTKVGEGWERKGGGSRRRRGNKRFHMQSKPETFPPYHLQLIHFNKSEPEHQLATHTTEKKSPFSTHTIYNTVQIC